MQSVVYYGKWKLHFFHTLCMFSPCLIFSTPNIYGSVFNWHVFSRDLDLPQTLCLCVNMHCGENGCCCISCVKGMPDNSANVRLCNGRQLLPDANFIFISHYRLEKHFLSTQSYFKRAINVTFFPYNECLLTNTHIAFHN